MIVLVVTLFSLGVLVPNETAKAENINNSEFDIPVEILNSSYRKSVTRNWHSGSYYINDSKLPYLRPIPQTIRANEMKNRQLYSGNLSLQQYYRNASGYYVATYVGTMYPDNSGTTPLSQILNKISEND